MVKELIINSMQRNQMILITEKVKKIVAASGIQNGIVYLFVPHTTAAITINENADPDVKVDMMYGLSEVVPEEQGFRHYEGNSDAHIKSSMIGVDQTIILHNGRLVLGTWQGIYFCDFDGPRQRRLIVKIMEEK